MLRLSMINYLKDSQEISLMNENPFLTSLKKVFLKKKANSSSSKNVCGRVILLI